MVKLGRTPGRPNSPFGVKWYFKPVLGRVVGRKPGVLRRSQKVIEINKKLVDAAARGAAPATKCKGKPWHQFVSCLRREMKAIVGKP